MPKEVGKIGTESPTFIEPLAERKDGIQAMFAKQTRKGTTAASPAKSSTRKRSAFPATEKTNVTGGTQPAKKARVEKVNAWEDDSDIEYVDDPPKRGRADDSNDSKVAAAAASLFVSQSVPNRSPLLPKEQARNQVETHPTRQVRFYTKQPLSCILGPY